MSVERVVAVSVGVYRRLLLLYPASFRREWGDEMLGVFGDLARDTHRTRGTWGLARLAGRTAVDLAVSLPDAHYRNGRRKMRRLTLGAWVVYLILLLGGVGIGAVGFGDFYERPTFTETASPDATEDQLLGAYEQALDGPYGTYRTFARGLGFAVALTLGLSAALFGVWQKSAWRGAAAFAIGALATVLSLSALPAIYFPFDHYPVPAVWVMGGPLLLGAVCWLLVTVAGRWIPGSGGVAAAT